MITSKIHGPASDDTGVAPVRRRLLTGMCAAVCSCTAARVPGLSSGLALAAQRRYCLDASSAPSASSLKPLSAFSNPGLAFFINKEIHDLLGSFFNLKFDVALDLADPGAYMAAYEKPREGRYGAIILGDRFLREKGNEPFGLLKTAGILSHECAHVFQVRYGTDRQLLGSKGQVRMVELHADYMSGGYIAWRSEFLRSKPVEVAAMFYSLGDTFVHSNQHHGTHSERFRAFRAGYEAYFEMRKTNQGVTVEMLAEKGLDDVLAAF